MRRAGICLSVALAIVVLACHVGCSKREQANAASSSEKSAAELVSAAMNTITVNRVPGAGVVILSKNRSADDDGQKDIIRIDLVTGRAERLIAAESLPRWMDGFVVSHDETHMAIIGSGEVGTGFWIWTRGSSILQRLSDEPDTGPFVQWSPSGRYLLIVADGHAKVYTCGKSAAIKLGECTGAFWCAKEDRVIAVVGPSDGQCTVYSVAPTGARKLMFRWPRLVENLVQSPNGRDYVFADDRGAYLATGGKRLSLGIKLRHNDWSGFAFSYNRTGSRLAVFFGRSYGEPHLNTEQFLWVVNPNTGHKLLVNEWQDTLLNLSNGVGTAYHTSLLGWSDDGKSIVCLTNIESSDGESLSSIRRDRNALTAYTPTEGRSGGKDLFDSGPGCTTIEWLPATNKK